MIDSFLRKYHGTSSIHHRLNLPRFCVASVFAGVQLLPLASHAIAQIAPSGLVIENQATGSFVNPIDSSTTQLESNIVTLTVAEVAGITLTPAGVQEAPANISNSGPAQGDGALNIGDIVYFNFSLTNVGNDPTQFFIPGTPSIIQGGTQSGPIEIVALDPDGSSGSTPATDFSNIPITIRPEGNRTGDSTALGMPVGSIPSRGTLSLRVPVKVSDPAVIVTLGDTGSNDNTPLTQNQPYVASVLPNAPIGGFDVYTQDNPDNSGILDESAGLPINGDNTFHRQEASAINQINLNQALGDYGDAPDSYGTDSTAGNSGSDPSGARHTLSSNLYLGTVPPDAETDGQPSPNADGDGSEDDGITLPSPIEGRRVYTIPASNISATGTGALHAWVDFNKNGQFDPNEYATRSITNGVPSGPLDFSNILIGAEGTTFARFRFTTDLSIGQNTPGGLASDGEVEDYSVAIAPATGPVEFCTLENDIQFVPPTEENIAQGRLSWPTTAGTSTQTYINVNGTGIDIKATTYELDGTTPTTDVEFFTVDNAGRKGGLSSPSGTWQLSLEFFETGTSTPAPISGIRHIVEDFEGDSSNERIGNFEYTPSGGTLTGLNSATEVSVIDTFSGTPSISNNLFQGYYSNEPGTQAGKWVMFEAAPSQAYTRIDVELHNGGALSPIVNLCQPLSVDSGDAPNSYGDARHVSTSTASIYLGNTVSPDVEFDTQNSANGGTDGSGDDSSNVDDENGISLPGTLNLGAVLSIPVTVTGEGNLNAWVDWDRSGTFEPSEQIATNVIDGGPSDLDGNEDGIITLQSTVPANASAGLTYARFRYGSDVGLGPKGPASDGEIEDYPVTLQSPAGSCANPINAPFNTSNYPLNTELQDSPNQLPLSFYGDTMRFNATLSGAASWANGVQIQNSAAFGEVIYLQPTNAADYLNTPNKATYTFSFPEPVTNLVMQGSGLNNFDGNTIQASYQNNPIPISSVNFSNLDPVDNSPSNPGMMLVDSDGNGQTETVIGKSSAGGVSIDTNVYTLTIAGPVDTIIITSGKESASTSTVTIGLHSFSYCLDPVVSNPNVLLVKRITAINGQTNNPNDGTALNSYVNRNGDEDNHPNWPQNGGTPTLLGETLGGVVKPNDEVEYTIYFLSAGNQAANDVLFCDRIPDNQTFIPNPTFTGITPPPIPAPNGNGSEQRGILVSYAGLNATYTNIGGDDTARFYAPGSGLPPACNLLNNQNQHNGAIVVNLGNLPPSTGAGTPINSHGFVRFRARVNP